MRLPTSSEPRPRPTSSATRAGPLALGQRTILHDLAGLFAAANGYAQVALLDVEEDHPAHQALQMLTRVLWRAENASQGLASEAAAGRSVLRPVDLCRLAREAVATAESLRPEHVRLLLRVPEHEVLVRADAAQVIRVLLNLIENSQRAVQGSRGRIVVAIEFAHAGSSSDGRAVILSVRDDGHGMDAPTLRRATECLFTRGEAEGRTGLGLWMADRVLDAHGGRLELESARGAGTHVRLHLPLLA